MNGGGKLLLGLRYSCKLADGGEQDSCDEGEGKGEKNSRGPQAGAQTTPPVAHMCLYKHARPHTHARVRTYAPLHASVSFREWLQHRRLPHLPRVNELFLQTESPARLFTACVVFSKVLTALLKHGASPNERLHTRNPSIHRFI